MSVAEQGTTAVAGEQSDAAVAVTSCRACGSANLHQVLDLGAQPACDHFPLVEDSTPDPRWPLALVLCTDCTQLQLDHDSPAPEEPRAVESATLQRHAVEAAGRVLDRLGAGAGTRVREFPSHHGGSWQEALLARGCVAVDSEADLVIDNQNIIHFEDFNAEFDRLVAALSPDGHLVVEFHHTLAQLVEAQFDTVRHGHPLYFSLHSWRAACERAGLSVVDAWREDVFGGCLIVVARRGDHPASPAVQQILAEEVEAGATTAEGYASFAERQRQVSSALRTHLEQAKAAGRRVLAYGAGSKSCTLLAVSEVGPDLLEMTADLSPAKQGRRIPGVGIPIVSPQYLAAERPHEVLILTWDIAPEVVAQLRELGLTETRFFVPMPTLREVG